MIVPPPVQSRPSSSCGAIRTRTSAAGTPTQMPSSSLVTLRSAPVSMLVALTEAFGMAAPFASGVSAYETWMPLLHGGQIVLAPPGGLEVGTLRRLIAEEGVTGLHLTAGQLRRVAAEAPDALAGLAELLTGGVVPPDAVCAVLDACPDLVVRTGPRRAQDDLLRTLEIPFEVHVYSAHRTPEEARNFARSARENGFGVLIAAAGMAAHLAGAIAANTTLPVIGIPCKSAAFGGIDALLSTVQMPTGIPVATVAVDGGANAALLAAQILAVEDAALAEKLDAKRQKDAQAVLEKDAAILERL